MADSYKNGDSLVRDYYKLSQENKERVWKYVKNLIRLQKAEKAISNRLYELKGSPQTAESEGCTGEFFCDFCGKKQNEVKRLIAGPADVFICDECARICGEILDEIEEEEIEEDNTDNND